MLKLNLTDDAVSKRNDNAVFLPPSQVVIDWSANGRAEPHRETDPHIVAMVASLKEHGQQQPITCRRYAEKRPQVVFGYSRALAAQIIEREDPTFRIAVILVECNDKEAFIRNIVENKERKDVSPIDTALNIRRLRESYGFTSKEVQELYKFSGTMVEKYMQLLTMDEGVRERVACGDLSMTAALSLIKLPAAEQLAAIDEATLPLGVSPVVEEEGEDASPGEGEALPGIPATEDDQALGSDIAALKANRKANPKKKPVKAPAKPAAPVHPKSKGKVDPKKLTVAARARGGKNSRTAADLLKLISTREDAVSKALTGFLRGEHDEAAVFEALDACEVPELETKVSKSGPVKSLKR